MFTVYLWEELQVLLHEGEAGLEAEPGVQELVLAAAGVVGPVAGQHVGEDDAAGAIAWEHMGMGTLGADTPPPTPSPPLYNTTQVISTTWTR